MPTVYVSSQESLGSALKRLDTKMKRERIGLDYSQHEYHMTDKERRRRKEHWKMKRRTQRNKKK